MMASEIADGHFFDGDGCIKINKDDSEMAFKFFCPKVED